ncbi:MAG: sulfite exporter TauE/SafE family protein [Bacteroidia bacterium]
MADKIGRSIKNKGALLYVFLFVLLLIAVYLGYYYSPVTPEVGKTGKWGYIFIGFIAEVVNGAIGMAYGITTTTLLLASGVAPALTIIVVHILEVFTAGATGLIHFKMGNVNKKLFKLLLIPGIIGAITGACVLYALKDYVHIIKPVISAYLLVLGLVILYRAFRKIGRGKKIKYIFPLGLVAGFLDSIGGGGWSTVVSSTLIAGGRNARYTIGSVVLSRCFVALVSSITLISLIGFTNWFIVAWLVVGGLAGSPIGPYLARHIPVKITMILVAIAVIIISLKQIFF